MKGIYDIHTHIIPEVDDGADTLKTAKKMIRREYADGMRTIVLTPHFRKGMFEPPMTKVQAGYQKVQELAAELAPDLQVLLGCEFHVNTEMVQMLKHGERPTLNGTSCVLTEFSQLHTFQFIENSCHELLTNGYTPVIAHAERYPILQKNMDYLERLHDMGAYIQMNADSISGAEGLRMKWFCKKVMKRDLLHFVGSDAHNMKNRMPQMGRCAEYMEKHMGCDYTKQILIRNPKKMLRKTVR